MTRTIEHLTPARIEELWPYIEPLLYHVVYEGIDAPTPTDPEYIRITAQHGVTNILGIFDGEHLDLIVVSEFAIVRGVKTASISAMAGKGLLKARSEVWQDILAWFKAAGACAVDAYAKPRLARIYQQKFGFDQGCSYIRMAL